MSIRISKVTEYTLTCDRCGIEEYTTTLDGNVNDTESAIKHLCFHKYNSKLLCEDCFLLTLFGFTEGTQLRGDV